MIDNKKGLDATRAGREHDERSCTGYFSAVARRLIQAEPLGSENRVRHDSGAGMGCKGGKTGGESR
jgi:hypothetical protein